MQLLFLGTTGYHPNNRRQTACLMIPEIGLILDAGTGIFRAREHLVTDELDIFLTHAHLDHSMGLTFLFDVLYEKKMKSTLVHAEREKIAALQDHLFSPLLFPVMPPFEFRELPARSSKSEETKDSKTKNSTANKMKLRGDCQLSWFPLEHPGGSLGYRLDFPNYSIAYVTDTTADPKKDYVELIRGVDLLVHECYFPDGWEDHAKLTGHSCITPVANVAKAAEVGKMILVHVNPMSDEVDPVGLDTARKIFKNTDVATDNLAVEFEA